MKRLLALMLTLVMLFSIALTASAEDLPICDEPITITLAGPKPSGLEDWTQVYLIKNFAAKLGINIDCQFVNSADWSTQMTLMVASDTLTDMVGNAGLNVLDVNKWGSEGYLLNINEYRDLTPNMNAYFAQYPEAEAYMTAPDGGLYGLCKISLDETDRFSRTFLNKVWLDRLGLEVPTTIDELYDVFVAFKEQDANGNGNPDDEIPFLYHSSMTASERILLSAFGITTSEVIYILQADADGNVYLANTTENYKEYMKWMAKCFAEGLIDPEAYVMDSNDYQNKATQDLYGFYGCGSAPFVVARTSIDYDKTFTGIAALTGPYNDELVAGKAPCVSTKVRVAINAKSPNAEAIVRMMDYMYTDEGEINGTMGFDGETFDWTYNELLGVNVPKMRVLEGCASGEETRYKFATLNETLNVIEWNNDRRALFTAPIEVVSSDEILTEYGWAALVALANRADGIISADCFPKLSFTAEESAERATLRTDIASYLEQAKAQFITGEIDVDEGWDTFVSTLEAMGIGRLLEIEQAAYDRFLEVIG